MNAAPGRGVGKRVDVLVIGGGAAGLGAAAAARWEGASVTLISDAPLGGDCTWTGCVPSKSLVDASRQGLTFREALDRVAEVSARIGATEDAVTLGARGVEVVKGRAVFIAPRAVELHGAGQRFVAKHVMIATGSRAAIPRIDGLRDLPYRTNETFFEARSQPESLIVIGAGPAGCELGEAMQRFGTRVTLVESGPRILGAFEPDASALVAESLRGRGVQVETGATTERVSHDGTRFRLELSDGAVVEGDEILVAAGRVPNTRGLGLDVAGVRTDEHGFITTDRRLRTTARRHYAVGDVNGRHMLSHAADEMGRVAVWNALRPGRRYRYDERRVPQAVFTTPEVATIGVTEADAPANARVAELPMHANDRALASANDDGFVRMIAKRDWLTGHRAGGKLIGATIVGERAGELVNECALVMRSNSYAARLAQTVRAYPSWSTIMQKTAALWFYDIEGHTARSPRR